jgi:ubiquinone/menaquinone biosynthesis C-methylase UbiE
VLDVGCGQGDVLLALSRQIEWGVGMDISGNEVAAAERKRKKRRIKNLEFLQANALDIPFPSNAFDVVLCLGDVLNYSNLFWKEGRVLAEIKRVLKRDGLTAYEGMEWDWDFRMGSGSWTYFSRTKDGRFHFNRAKRTASGRETSRSYEVLPSTPLHHWILKQQWPISPQGFTCTLDIVEEKPIPRKWLKFRDISKNRYLTLRGLKRNYEKAGFKDVEVFPYGETYDIVTKAGLLETIRPHMAKLAKAEAELILETRQGSGPWLFLIARR